MGGITMNINYEEKLRSLHDYYGDWVKEDVATPKMTTNLYPYDKMFTPIKVNSLTLKNRLVMAPIGNVSMCDETGRPNEQMIQYFAERAKGGVGLITTGLIPVSYGIDPSLIELGDLVYFPRIDRSRTTYVGWRELASNVHSHGASIFIQLSAGLGRVGNPQCLINSLKLPVSASFNPNFYISQIPCRPLTDFQCTKIIKKLGQGAADAKAANIDGVYLHAHEGYLMEQLANPAFNRRKLGKYKDWQRFGIDSIKHIRERVGDKYPIMYRIDLSLALNATYGEKMNHVSSLKKFKNERTVEQTLEYMANLVKAGVDMFDVDLGCYDNWWLPHPPSSMPPACLLDIAEIAKVYFKENGIKSNVGLEVPVVAVGKLGYPDIAEKALKDDKCDMVMLGRPLLADPYWPSKAYQGKCRDITPCIGCQEACINEFVEGGHPQCAVNPRCAFESVLPAQISIADSLKKVAVIGAGPAGITACEVLLKRGHKVDLYEKNNEAGGMIIPGSKPKIKYEIANYLEHLADKLDGFKKHENFKAYMGKEITASELKEKGYDVVITATGTMQLRPPIKGISGKNVFSAIDVLARPEIVKDAKDIVVIGGGVVGTETAYYLKYELDKNVKIIEMEKYIMNHTCTANRGHILHYLQKAGVEILNMTKVLSIAEDGVVVARNMAPSVPDPYNTWAPILPENILNPLAPKIKEDYVEQTLKADLVILSAGVKSDNEIYYTCLKERVASEVYNIGDSYKPGKVMEAVKTAYRKALSI